MASSGVMLPLNSAGNWPCNRRTSRHHVVWGRYDTSQVAPIGRTCEHLRRSNTDTERLGRGHSLYRESRIASDDCTAHRCAWQIPSALPNRLRQPSHKSRSTAPYRAKPSNSLHRTTLSFPTAGPPKPNYAGPRDEDRQNEPVWHDISVALSTWCAEHPQSSDAPNAMMPYCKYSSRHGYVSLRSPNVRTASCSLTRRAPNTPMSRELTATMEERCPKSAAQTIASYKQVTTFHADATTAALPIPQHSRGTNQPIPNPFLATTLLAEQSRDAIPSNSNRRVDLTNLGQPSMFGLKVFIEGGL